MIDVQNFISFIHAREDASIVWMEEFKPNLVFVQVDCFENKPYKLAIEIADDVIKFAKVNKSPELDFSLYDYVFSNNIDAEQFFLQVKQSGYPNRDDRI